MSDSSNKKRPAKKRNHKHMTIYVLTFSSIICLALIVGGAAYLFGKYMPNLNTVSVYNYYDFWNINQFQIINGEELLSDPVYEAFRSSSNNEVYICHDYVKDYIDKYIFFDEAEKLLILTTTDTVTRITLDSRRYYENDIEKEYTKTFILEAHKAYLPISFLTERYNVEISLGTEYKTIIIDHKKEARSITTVKQKSSVLRYNPDIKSPIAEKLVMGDMLTVYEADGSFTKVRTSDGLIGYINTKHLDETEEIAAVIIPEAEITFAKPLEGKITLLWDQVTTVAGNAEPLRRQTVEGVDVLSPTWFSFDAEKLDGNIVSVADKAYVDFAHQNGYQVWALITDNFNSEVSHSVVSRSSTRERVIKQLIKYVNEYKLDGINIDFESVRKDDAAYYLQFIRELAPALHHYGAYLSVDMFVPSPWSMYYNRAEVGKAADFICIMAYDEHYSGSPVSGPVASLGFVDSGVADTLEEVAKEKIIMGMPFYVRVWREERDSPDGAAELTVRNYGMEYAREIFKNKNAEFIWLEEVGSFYSEYFATEDGKHITYKVWLEDEYSIEQKLKIAEKYDVAGVACWKRGLEKQNVWALISQYMN